MFLGSAAAKLTKGALGSAVPQEATYNTFGFDGADDAVNLGNVLNIGTSDYAFSFWFKSAGDTTDLFILDKGVGLFPAWNCYLKSDGKLVFRAALDSSNRYVTETDNTYDDDSWHFVVWNLGRAANAAEVYIDGVLVATTETTQAGSLVGADLSVSGNYYLGARDFTTENNFNGSLTSYGFYNDELSAEQALNLYNVGKVPYYETLPSSITSISTFAVEMSSRDSTLNDLVASNNGTAIGGVSADGATQTFASYS